MPKNLPQFPVYVISKGRHDVCYTADFLEKDGIPFHIVVEPQEQELYAARYGKDRILVLPFSNLGLGGIPARNWVWEHSKAAGHDWHWILDDNIQGVYRMLKGKRIICNSGVAFKVTEDFTLRYTNIAIAGLNYYFFVGRSGKQPPFYLNTHVYSCLLIRNELPFRWRGRYNEDTDLCLQALTQNWCTVNLNQFTILKSQTMTMKGGNATELYKGDGRLKMAKTLERAWPYVVQTKRRFDRPQHVVKDNWKRFDQQLIRRSDIDWEALEAAGSNNYGMKVKQVSVEIKSEKIKQLLESDKTTSTKSKKS